MARDLGFVGEPNSPGWMEARQSRIGGSDIGAICGWSRFDTREEIIQRKLGNLPEKALTPAMDRGNRLEEPVLLWLQDKLGLQIDRDAHKHTFVHDEHDWMVYNPDGIAYTDDGTMIVLEAKTCSDRSTEFMWGRAGGQKFPTSYQAQVTWGMGIMGCKTAYLGVLRGAINGRPDLGFDKYLMHFDKTAFATLQAKGQEAFDEMTERKGLLWD